MYISIIILRVLIHGTICTSEGLVVNAHGGHRVEKQWGSKRGKARMS